MANPWEEKAQRAKATGIITTLMRLERDLLMSTLQREPTMLEVLHATIKLVNTMSDTAWLGATIQAGFQRKNGKATCSAETRKLVVSELVGLLPSPLESLEWRKLSA